MPTSQSLCLILYILNLIQTLQQSCLMKGIISILQTQHLKLPEVISSEFYGQWEAKLEFDSHCDKIQSPCSLHCTTMLPRGGARVVTGKQGIQRKESSLLELLQVNVEQISQNFSIGNSFKVTFLISGVECISFEK